MRKDLVSKASPGGRASVGSLVTALLIVCGVISPGDNTQALALVHPSVTANHAGRSEVPIVRRRTPTALDREDAVRRFYAEVEAQLLRQDSAQAASSPHNFTNAWTPLGPTPMTGGIYAGPNSGRVTSVATSSLGTIFAGTAGGGVWSSTNGGASWVTHTDGVFTGLAIGALAVDPTNPQIVYAGTGEDNGCSDCFYGNGVLKSTDAGNTWSVENPGGVFTGADFASLVVDPHNAQDLYAGTDVGFFESTDGGITWALPAGIYDFGPLVHADGVVIDPTTSPTTVYVATEGVGIEKSTDGGVNFSTLGGGLPTGSHVGVTALAIGTSTARHPTANQDLYAAIQLNQALDHNRGQLSLFSSTNGGTTWNHLSTPPYTTRWAFDGKSLPVSGDPSDQAWYDNTLAVDPSNPAHVLAGGIALIETTDGGHTWTNANGQPFFGDKTNKVHPDFHAVTFNKAGLAVIGCDGGIYTDRATLIANRNSNLDTAQFYEGMSVYRNGATILGGTQDNGTVLTHGGKSWPEVLAGDGGYTAVNILLPTQQFAEADEHLVRTGSEWQQNDETDITPPGAETSGTVNANFVPPFASVPNPTAPSAPTLYYGAHDLWVTHNPAAKRPTWVRLIHTRSIVSAIAVAPSNPADVYIGLDNGAVFASNNATSPNPTFTGIAFPGKYWVTDITVTPTDPTSIVVTHSSYDTPYTPTPPLVDAGTVRLSSTPPATWTDITGNLPSGASTTSVVFDQSAIVVATDVGVFDTSSPNPSNTIWETAGIGLPNAQIIGLTVDNAGTLYAATFGRGAWKLNQ